MPRQNNTTQQSLSTSNNMLPPMPYLEVDHTYPIGSEEYLEANVHQIRILIRALKGSKFCYLNNPAMMAQYYKRMQALREAKYTIKQIHYEYHATKNVSK